jgi:phage terminase small subunit
MPKLTDRQRLFCEHLNRGMSATEAARKAGYSDTYADRQAAQLLGKTQVDSYLQELRAASRDESVADGAERRRVLTEILRGSLVAPAMSKDGPVEMQPTHEARISAIAQLAKMEGDLAPVKIDITARVQSEARDWIGRVLTTVASVLGDEAAERLIPHLPVLELEK